MNTENHYQETDLGNISLNPRGEYNPEESYEYLDLVVLEGGSYVCLAENGATITGISPEPGKTTQYWQVITIPGSLTPEYIAMHDRVVNLSEQVGADAVEVRTAEQNVSGMELNVTQMQEQTRQSAEAAEQSKDSSAGYAASADASRQAAEESKQNIDAQVTGFDNHVAEKTGEAENDIEAARIAANKAIIAQQEQSVNEVARAGIEAISTAQSAAQTATEKAQAAATSEKNAAASETAAKLSEENATKMAEQVATDKEQVAYDRTAVENAKQEMTGSVAQIEQNTQGISELKTDLVNSFTSKKNLCTDLTPNTFYSAWGGVGTTVIRENGSGWTSATVELNGDEEYITMTIKMDEKPFSFFADADGKMISNVIDRLIKGNVYSVPTNAKFLYGSIQTENIEDINLGMVVFKGSNPITQNDFDITEVPYGETRFFADDLKTTNGTSIIDIEKTIKPIYVEKDGSGDFARLIDAIEEAEKTMNRVVYVGAGEWDIIEELGTDYIESINTFKRGVYLKNGIHLICSSRSIIKCNYTGTNESTIEWLSAFNAGTYGFTLENATIESSNCRYTVHDERDSDADHYKNVYKNCFMKHTKTCIGGGLGLDGHVIIDGCKFVNNEGDNSHVVSYHNSGDGYWEGTASKGAQSNVEVANSWFSGTFAVQTFGQSTKDTNFLVHGNSFASAPVYPLEANPVIKVTDWNNEIRTN